MAGPEWTPADLQRLREMTEAGASVAEIALALDRSEMAVRHRKARIGIRLETPTNCLFCGKPLPQIRGGRPRQWCSSRCKWLGLRERRTHE